MVRKITTQLELDGEKEFKDQMAAVNRELRTTKDELGYTEAAFRGQANTLEALTEKDRLLRKEVEQQEEKIRALNEALEKSSEIYGETDKRTDGYRQSLLKAKKELINMQEELDDTEKYLKEAMDSSDKCAKSIDGLGKDVSGAGEELGGFELSLDNLKGMLAGGAVVGGIQAVTGAILGVVEETKEYRQIMGTLEVSSKAAGYTADETAEAYKRLHGVLGDTQTAATTLSNLQAIGAEQDDLITIIDAATGAWAKYGDSIPIDGLAESINETIRAGQVTGTFADVINWGSDELETFGVHLKENIEFTELSDEELAKLTETQRAEYEATKAQYEAIEEWNKSVLEAKTSEDYFNLALQDCADQSARTQLMLDTLREQGLVELGEDWRVVNQDIIDMNEAEGELEAAMGRLGAILSPLAADLVSFGADALTYVIDKVKEAVDWFTSLQDKMKQQSQSRMESYGYEAYYNEDGYLRYRMADGSHANGLDFVPYDGYQAEMHYGERIMTATENSALDTLRRAVDYMESNAAGRKDNAAPQTINLVVHSILDGRKVGESTTTVQLQNRRANGR